MKHTMIALSFGFAGLIFATNAGFAATQCGARDNVLTTLSDKYAETRRGMGLAANNGVVEVFASDTTGSWTITVTMPNGTTCLIASGQSFEAMQDTLPATGKPT
jgi:hypothetical protein